MYDFDKDGDQGKVTGEEPGLGAENGDDSEDDEEDLDSWELEADLEE